MFYLYKSLSYIIFLTILFLIVFLMLPPKLAVTFSLLIEIILHFVFATSVLFLTPPSTKIEFYPKLSIYFN